MKRTMVALSALMCFASAAFAESFINLTTVKQDVVVTDGTRLHAVLDDEGSISIAPNATVTLWMAIIQGSSTVNGAGITCMGDATIILESENYICGRSSGFPAIYVPKGSTLTIKGTGRLTAIGNGFAAGIGGGDGQDCGNIVIDGGVITAKGGSSSNDGTITYITDDMIIPPGSNYKQNSIIIHPPTVNGGGPGIGAARDATCGKIVFSHGIVEAWASDGYPAIGAKDSKSKCPSVTFKQTIGKVSAVVKGVADDDIISAKNVYYGVVDGVPSGYAGTNTKKTEDGYPGGNKKVIGWNNYRTLSVASQLGSISKHKLVSDYYEVGNTVEWRRTVLRGELSGDYEIALADGAEVVFDCVTVAGALKTEMPGITCWGDAIIILKGENYIKGNGDCYPGIFVPEGHTLKIQGDGSLTVVGGGSYATAIGGVAKEDEDSKKKSGTIRIISGEITAIGGEFASALGSTFEESGRVVEHGDGVEFYGGSVHARGGIPLDGLNSTYLSGGVKMTSDGDEEFFRWNGRLDKVPDALTEVADEVYIVAHDATTIRGKLPDPPRDDYWGFVYDREIRIADGARVTLKDAVVSRPKGGGSERSMEEGNVFSREKKGQWSDYFIKETNTPRYHSGIRCMGDAEITIQGDNSIAGTDFMAGIFVADGKKLTLKGDGSLSVYGGKEGGGIDGGSDVIIDGGVINAYGGDGGSGIGASRIEFNGGSTTAIAYETGASQEDLEDFHALGYSESSTIVIGKSLKREKEEVVGYNSSGHFKNCTEKVSFDGDLVGLGEEEEDVAGDDEDDEEDEDGPGEQGGGKKMVMKAASARKGLLGDSDADPDPTEYALTLKNVRSGAIAGTNTVITGTLSGFHKVAIAHDAIVTLRDATIVQGHGDSTPYAGLTCLGNATIRLEGRNYIWSFHAYYPAISVPPGCTLTIEGPGALYAHGGSFGAGIGGGFDMDCGKIVINGGEIHAYGGLGAAGIGGGAKAGVGAIVLNGGTIEATSSTPVGTYSPASGIKYVGSAPGIGVGWSGTGDEIVINSGIAKVTAKRGNENCDHIGAGAGGTIDGNEVPVNISGVLLSAVDGNTRTLQWSGDLGVDDAGDKMELTALDGTTITGSNAMPGAYKKVNVRIAPGAKVTLDSATIDGSLANLPDSEFLGAVTQWAGITCLGDAEITLVGENRVDSFNCEYPCVYVPKGSALTIKGSGSLLADNTRNHARGAGIGGGSRVGINSDCGRIIIDGGTVHGYSNGYSTDSGYADGLGYSAGIGSGPDGWCQGIEIGAGITEVRGMNKAGVNMSPNSRPQLSAAPIGGGARGSAQVYPAHGLEDNYIGTWADRVFRSLPRVDLSQATGDVMITMDSIVTGRLPGDGLYKVTIKAGAEVTLKDVTIYGHGAGIYCEGNASVWIEGMNYIQGKNNYPGIYVPEGWALHIYAKSASDYLTVCGGSDAAGIGSGDSSDVRQAGAIWIHGGHVVATGGTHGAGIGTGPSAGTGTKSNCEFIGIDGGSVLATGGDYGAGIGSGMNSTCGDIYISSNITRVVAERYNSNAAHIGSGCNGLSGDIDIDESLRDTVSGNTRTLEYNPDIDLSSIIGKASNDDELEVLVLDTAVVSGNLTPARKIVIADGATVTLRDVTITGTFNSAYDGTCHWAGNTCEGDATIILEGANVVRGFHENYPGIYVPRNRKLTIKGDGSLDASSNGFGAGIGAGYNHLPCGDIVIENGTIVATGGDGAAGIGGAYGSGCGDITIGGGFVTANGGATAAGIGCGYQNVCGGITIAGNTRCVVATGGEDMHGYGEGNPIGLSASGGSCPGVTYGAAMVVMTDGRTSTIVNKNVDLGWLNSDFTLQDGMTVSGTLQGNYKVSIAAGASVTLNQAEIQGENSSSCQWAGLTCLGDATITLRNSSTIRGFHEDYPGIYVPTDCTLTINGYGGLDASSNGWGAGIGGGYKACGNIVIGPLRGHHHQRRHGLRVWRQSGGGHRRRLCFLLRHDHDRPRHHFCEG